MVRKLSRRTITNDTTTFDLNFPPDQLKCKNGEAATDSNHKSALWFT